MANPVLMGLCFELLFFFYNFFKFIFILKPIHHNSLLHMEHQDKTEHVFDA